MDNKCIASNCRSSKPVERYKLFSVNQPECTVKNLLKYVENNVGLSIPKQLDTTNGTSAVTLSVSNLQNLTNATEDETSTLISKLTTNTDNVKSEKNVKLDDFVKSYDIENQHVEPNTKMTAMFKVVDMITNKTTSHQKTGENNSNDLEVNPVKSILIRFEKKLLYSCIVIA